MPKSPRDWKVSKYRPKVRLSGDKGSAQSQLRNELYRFAYERLDEASEQGMHFEVIALCDMLITDRVEAYCQYLLHNEDMQFETMSANLAIEALEVALKDNAPDVKKSLEWQAMSKRLRDFANARNTCLHSFILIKNAAKDATLAERIEFLEDTAEDGYRLVREIDTFTRERIKAKAE
ncbi:hypothetical protein [Aliiroseovarius sp. xm-g-7]|uniref:hypothetical protein n=1 Tax=Aliiroseovarius sp. xm-g-7 TaxID=2651826 RepID=UPI001568F4CE|nr:hypothetical protein [Aliiroseovarius sp. xm-g-7]NRQ25858.1 hypothetical protein [Aliiroseovarius sp. xm-g-7]